MFLNTIEKHPHTEHCHIVNKIRRLNLLKVKGVMMNLEWHCVLMFVFVCRWIMEQQQRSLKLIFMAVALLIESLFCVTNSQDTRKGKQQNAASFLSFSLAVLIVNYFFRSSDTGVRLLIYFFLFFRFAYIEFADKESVRTAMALDESLFRGRQIKVKVFKPTSV